MLRGCCAVGTSVISPQESSDVITVFVEGGGTERGSEEASGRAFGVFVQQGKQVIVLPNFHVETGLHIREVAQ